VGEPFSGHKGNQKGRGSKRQGGNNSAQKKKIGAAQVNGEPAACVKSVWRLKAVAGKSVVDGRNDGVQVNGVVERLAVRSSEPFRK